MAIVSDINPDASERVASEIRDWVVRQPKGSSWMSPTSPRGWR